MSIIKHIDQNELIPTASYKFGKFPFEKFNPVQSRVFEFFDKDCNLLVAAATSSGKTVVAEMVAAHELRTTNKKVVYLAPLKALAKEKIEDWTDEKHHFGDLKLSICTGDYRLTTDRKKEIEEANIVLMTSEMLSSRVRNFNSENNDWLKNVGVLVVDECQLLGGQERGTHLEVALMKFSNLNPKCKLILLSATMPNVAQIAEWVKTLNGKETYLVESSYRPCPLGIHYETYWSEGRYEDQEEEKVITALSILEDHKEDKFLIFAHGKKTGELMKTMLKKAGYECEFYCADLDKEKRGVLEKRFREDETFKILVATSSLAIGVNTPARRVIILGVHRGLSEVENYDLLQMQGRAGRPKYDPRGDAYVLLPSKDKDRQKERVSKCSPITSRLLDLTGKSYKSLAFHLVSEIHHGDIKTKDDIINWYKRSLGYFQTQDLDKDVLENTVKNLLVCGAIKEEEGFYKATVVGKIASMFYYNPFDVADLRRNFSILFDTAQKDSDMAVSISLGNIDSTKMGIVSKADREEMENYAYKVKKLFGDKLSEHVVKSGYAYYGLLNSLDLGTMVGFARNLQFDFQRMTAVLKAIDSMSCKWNEGNWFDDLQLRVSYGVKQEFVPLCRIPNIGKVRAEKLYFAGITTPQDVANSFEKVQKILNMNGDKVKAICEDAKKLMK
jgi:helicase